MIRLRQRQLAHHAPPSSPAPSCRWSCLCSMNTRICPQRKEHWLKRTAYAAFYRLLQRVANIEIPLDAGDFCIMDRRVVDLLVGMPERNRFVRGIRSWVGLDQVGLAYERHARQAGKPKYTLPRLTYLALDGLVSFSYVPLRAITTVGLCISVVSMGLAAFYTINKITIGLN